MQAEYCERVPAVYDTTGMATQEPKWLARFPAIVAYISPSQPHCPVVSYNTSVERCVPNPVPLDVAPAGARPRRGAPRGTGPGVDLGVRVRHAKLDARLA